MDPVQTLDVLKAISAMDIRVSVIESKLTWIFSILLFIVAPIYYQLVSRFFEKSKIQVVPNGNGPEKLNGKG
ncbi:MAG: hypothetical protein WC530_07970 [Candidatus Omnitrophota bacterium]|jgi:RsiW-degrading membrane proteinase PrsW (M82 family)